VQAQLIDDGRVGFYHATCGFDFAVPSLPPA
jgi:hypothetical protein